MPPGTGCDNIRYRQIALGTNLSEGGFTRRDLTLQGVDLPLERTHSRLKRSGDETSRPGSTNERQDGEQDDSVALPLAGRTDRFE